MARKNTRELVGDWWIVQASKIPGVGMIIARALAGKDKLIEDLLAEEKKRRATGENGSPLR